MNMAAFLNVLVSELNSLIDHQMTLVNKGNSESSLVYACYAFDYSVFGGQFVRA
jgi:hypothetical protein